MLSRTHARTHSRFGVLTLAAIGGFALSAPAGEPPASPPSTKSVGAPVAESLSPQLKLLDLFVGPWSVVERHFNARGEQVAIVKGTEEIVWILDHHAIRRNYMTRTESAVFQAIGTLTFNSVAKHYQGVWLDNRSTAGPTTVTGEWSEETRSMVLTLESSGKNGTTIRHKVIERFLDEKRREAVTYLLRGSEVIKRMEVQYQRTIPCPARLRTILDELTRG
ncbi:MAG: DUF1579 family protein [Planctomycetes bacterium]|nr:DUF1579 family protein [Planctomycetota bacterium]